MAWPQANRPNALHPACPPSPTPAPRTHRGGRRSAFPGPAPATDRRSGSGSGSRAGLGLALALFFGLGAGLMPGGSARAATLQDAFAQREILPTASGQLSGSNVGATREAQEPAHANKSGGASVWVSWIAPTNGMVTFRTTGSGFDTLLAAYYFKPSDPETLDRLEEASANDDDPAAAPASWLQFAARAGQRFEIAIDGFRGAAGSIALAWDFVDLASEPPIVVSLPTDRALRLGDPLTLSASFDAPTDARLQWRFNDESFGAEGPTLFIPSLQATNVGRYSLRIRLGDVRFETKAVEIQVNSEGATNALARDKAFDSIDSGLTDDSLGRLAPGGGGDTPGFAPAAAGVFVAAAGVSRGYNGTQIFNTTYATADPSEPRLCGGAGGASYWFAYTPPAAGTLIVDTLGSSYDTVLASFLVTSPITGFDALQPLACDNDALAPAGADRISVAVTNGQQYLLAVDGVNGARGFARLNYHLIAATNGPAINFTNVSATYHGLFGHQAEPPLESAGWLSVRVRPNGAYSGVLQQAQRRLGFSGRFDPDGRARLQIPRTGSNRVALELLAGDSPSGPITGRLESASWALDTVANRAADFLRDTNLAALVGRYTLLLPGAAPPSSDAPVGDSYAVLNVLRSGAVSAAGVLADGQRFSQAGAVTVAREWPLFAALPRGAGAVLGIIQVRPRPDAGQDLAGTVYWRQAPRTSPVGLTNGFELASTIAGSAYVAPGRNRALPLESAELRLTLASGESLATNRVYFGPNARLTNAGPQRLTLAVVPATGVIQGTLRLTNAAPIALRGVLLPRQQLAGGYFIRSNAIGHFELVAP